MNRSGARTVDMTIHFCDRLTSLIIRDAKRSQSQMVMSTVLAPDDS